MKKITIHFKSDTNYTEFLNELEAMSEAGAINKKSENNYVVYPNNTILTT